MYKCMGYTSPQHISRGYYNTGSGENDYRNIFSQRLPLKKYGSREHMPILTEKSEIECVYRSVERFKRWFRQNGAGSVFSKFDIHVGPAEVRRINELYDEFSNTPGLKEKGLNIVNDPQWAFDDKLIPLVKRAIMHARRMQASTIDDETNRTHDHEVVNELRQKLVPYERIMKSDWFNAVDPIFVPPLAKYFASDEILDDRNILSKQSYLLDEDGDHKSEVDRRPLDEKFHILQAPFMFLRDLSEMRDIGDFRGSPVTAVYLDIDNFKRFNTEYGGETEIDLKMLPIFMKALESHVYHHGWAYRVGGDEYEILLPNMSVGMTVAFLREFQGKLEGLEYIGIEEKVTVSMGFCYVDSDCWLTDREIERMACRAKNQAKKEEGKNCIAGYEGILYGEEDLRIF